MTTLEASRNMRMLSASLNPSTHAPNPFVHTPLSKAYWSLPENIVGTIHSEWALREYDAQWMIDFAEAYKIL